ncbi:hypothetical protein B0J18DRAFT_40654 [Chaetomium sp. MPI-SDFR-AT-0129]|nr:hypothetical protein B0J18DRAFT_40654 [Chaetomium sp. MPI-SDFR-AT-0129]
MPCLDPCKDQQKKQKKKTDPFAFNAQKKDILKPFECITLKQVTKSKLQVVESIHPFIPPHGGPIRWLLLSLTPRVSLPGCASPLNGDIVCSVCKWVCAMKQQRRQACRRQPCMRGLVCLGDMGLLWSGGKVVMRTHMWRLVSDVRCPVLPVVAAAALSFMQPAQLSNTDAQTCCWVGRLMLLQAHGRLFSQSPRPLIWAGGAVRVLGAVVVSTEVDSFAAERAALVDEFLVLLDGHCGG